MTCLFIGDPPSLPVDLAPCVWLRAWGWRFVSPGSCDAQMGFTFPCCLRLSIPEGAEPPVHRRHAVCFCEGLPHLRCPHFRSTVNIRMVGGCLCCVPPHAGGRGGSGFLPTDVGMTLGAEATADVRVFRRGFWHGQSSLCLALFVHW